MKQVRLDKLLQGNICILGAISQLLLNKGINISEEVLMGMAFGLKFRYSADEEKKHINLSCADLLLDEADIKKFFNELSADFICYKYYRQEDFLQFLSDHIADSIMLAIDSFYLQYQPTYMKSHEAHVVVLTNLNGTDYIVQDNYVSVIIPHNHKAIFSKDDIMKYSDLSECDTICRYLVWDIKVSDTGYFFSKDDVENRICTNIKINIQKEILGNGTYSGVLAFDRFIGDLEKYAQINLNDRKTLLDLNQRISAKGGLYQTRLLYGKFLEWYDLNYKTDECIKRYSQVFAEISRKWKIISTLLLKAALKGHSVNWIDILSRSKEVIQLEKNYYTEIYVRTNQNKGEHNA